MPRSPQTFATEAHSGIYGFQQNFQTPDGEERIRTGFIARLRVQALGDPVRTLCASECSGSVLVLYRANKDALRTLAEAGTNSMQSDDGTGVRLWSVTDSDLVAGLLASADRRGLVIASGAAAYKAALAAGEQWMTAAFVDVDDPGLMALPLHRVVRGKPDYKTGTLVMNSRAYFFFREVTREMPPLDGDGPYFDAEIARRLMTPAAKEEVLAVDATEAGARVSPGAARNSMITQDDTVMMAVTRKQTFLLHAKPGWSDSILRDLPAAERNVDAVRLHRIILEGVLELPPEELRERKFVSYHRDATEAAREVQRGADVAFIMSAPRVRELYELALAGDPIPYDCAEFIPVTYDLPIHAHES